MGLRPSSHRHSARVHQSVYDNAEGNWEQSILCQTCRPVIERHAKSLATDSTLRDDLVQEGNLAVLEAIPKYNPHHDSASTFLTFVFPRIRGRMLNYLRAERKHTPPASTLLRDSEPTTDRVDHAVIRRLDLEGFVSKIETLFESLSPRQRQVIERCYFQEQKPTQVARRLGVAPARVTQLKKAALMRLRIAYLRSVGGCESRSTHHRTSDFCE